MSESENLPAAPDLSPAAKQRARMDALMTAVSQRQDQLSTLLGDSNIDPKRFLEVIRRALMKNPDLLVADAGSVIEACINAATDGLLPDGRQGAIVIYNVNIAPQGQQKRYGKKAQWIPMVQGLLDIAYRSGNFRSIAARVVYEGDEYSYSLGLRPEVRHVPKQRPAGTTPAIVAAYAVALTKDGGEFFEPFEGEDIRKVRAVSRAASGPSKDWPEEMTRKGPLKRMWKYLPKDDRMARVGERDSEVYELDVEEAPEPPERKLTAGFAPQPQQQAITQGADLPIDVEMEDVRDEDPDGLVDAQPKANQAKEQAKVVAPEPEPEPEDEAPMVPETFQISVNVAKSFLNLKQALRVVQRTAPTVNMHVARRVAWGKFVDVNEAAEVKTDFVTDPVLFQMWLDGTLPAPDQVDKNWALVQRTEAFGKLSDQDKEAVAAHVAQARGGRAMEESQ